MTGGQTTSVCSSTSSETQNGFNNTDDTFLVVISTFPCLLAKHEDKGSMVAVKEETGSSL